MQITDTRQWWPCRRCSRRGTLIPGRVREGETREVWVHENHISYPVSHNAEPEMPFDATPEEIEEWLTT